MHIDRCEALAHAVAGDYDVIGLQWTGTSLVYNWEAQPVEAFRLVTLFPGRLPRDLTTLGKLWAALRFCLRADAEAFFFSHYNDTTVILLAWLLKAFRRRVFGMALSKFDDYDRRVGREMLKSVALIPYAGFLTNLGRSADYLRFLRHGRALCAYGHNTLSVVEIRRLAGAPPAPGGVPHAERYFTAIARLIAKKNLFMLIDAYALYRTEVARPRDLHICGSGPLENEIRSRIEALGLGASVVLTGDFVQRQGIARELAGSLALILPSIEEQFGNVIIEALAMGVPALVSDNCGARETLIRSGVNGFLIEPDNPKGLVRLMERLAEDEGLWRRLSEGCSNVERCDTQAFVKGVLDLTSRGTDATRFTKRPAHVG